MSSTALYFARNDASRRMSKSLPINESFSSIGSNIETRVVVEAPGARRNVKIRVRGRNENDREAGSMR